MKEREEKLKGLKDMIDMRKLMNSKPELVIPKKIYISTSSIRNVILNPITIPLFEFLTIFLIGGLVMILPSEDESLASSWSSTTGIIFALLYLVFFSIDLYIFITMNLKMFYYTFLTLVGRIISGILINIYATANLDAIFAWLFFFLSVTLVLSILKSLNEESLNFVYHCINVFIIIVGGLLVSLANSQVNPYYIFMIAVCTLLYQISVFHELGLVKYLWSLNESEWEDGFIHIAPRIAYYVKRFWEEGEGSRTGRVLDFEGL